LADPKVSKGAIIPDERQKIKREGYAVTEYLAGSNKIAVREGLYAYA